MKGIHMKLYYSNGACSLAVRIVIHEIGIDSEFESVDLKTKKTEKGDDFLKINPKGGVPVIRTDDNKILTENSVIQQFLADKYKAHQLLPVVDDFKRYQVLEWLNYVATELHKGYGPIFNQDVPKDVKDNIFFPLIKKKLGKLDTHFEHNKYLLGDTFTLPDAYLCVVLVWSAKFKMDFTAWPHLSRYFDDLKKRDSVKRAFKEEGI